MAEVYLAVVADDRPWSEPAQETVAPRDHVTWEVGPGTYRIVASAPQFTTDFGEPFTVAASDVRDVLVALTPLVPVRGFAVDETGHPVAGASIRRLDGGNSLSVLGERHRRVNTAATTSATGGFTIFVPADRNETFLVEASLYSPAILDAARLAGGPDSRVVMEEGASLRVRWSTSSIERPEKISLLPVDVTLPRGLTRYRALTAWTRAIVGNEQRWDALPPGTYQIVVRAAGVATGMSVPIEIGEVILGPGDDATVPIVLPPVIEPDEQPPARTVRVLIPEVADDPGRLVVSQWREGVRLDMAATPQQVSGGTLLTMPAFCVPGSVVMVESLTGIGTAVLDGGCEEPVRVRLTESANVAARIRVPSGTRLPRSGSLRFAKCAADATPVEIPFAISDSHVRTNAPAGCGEMTLRAAGFVPVRLSSQALKAGESRDLGTVTLPEGAAAVLRIRAGSDAVPLEGVRITAVRPADLSSMRGQLDAEPVSLGTAISDASGWARLTGLPEGRVIFLMQGRGRKRPQVSEPYELEAGEETVIDDLVVETPANVFVTVAVPESLEQALELHAVELEGAGHTHWPSRAPIRAELTLMGTVVEDVPPGTWTLRATGRLKNGFALQLAETTIDVAAGVDRQVTLTLTDTLYHGRVTRGGLAVNGSINLKPADKQSRLRSAVAKIGRDSNGEFEVLLEGKGEYAVSVQDSGRRSVTLDHYITFDDPDDEVTIELPTGHEIRGRVVDSAGSPVEAVSVSAVQQIAEPFGSVGVLSSAHGRFVLDGVVPGRWELTAESKNERSEPVMVAVGQDDVDGITLVVDPVQTVKIRVVDMTGARLSLVNVQVEFLAPGAARPQFYGSLARRGEVEFRLSHAQQATPTNVVVQTLPDGRLSCEVRRLDSDQTIQVAPHAGGVRLIARPWTKIGTRNWLVSSSGCAVPFFARAAHESDGREALVFQRLAAGKWTYVVTHNAQELAAIFTGRGTSLTPIKTFLVEPGKTTRVDLSEN